MADSETPDYRDINIPASLLINLDDLGIEEVDTGTCEDTFENRQILRAHDLTWREVYNEDGSPSNWIVAMSPEAMKLKVLQKKAAILTDARDVNSDYETGVDLLLVPDIETYVPGWVLGATRKFNKIERERERTGKNVTPHLATAPGRCEAIKVNGQRCVNWHGGTVKENGYCRMHLSRTGTEVNTVAKARNRMLSGAVAAVTRLETLMETATSEQVQLKASTELLDRVGIRGGVEVDQKVEIEVQPAALMITERLRKLGATPTEQIEDAEVVEQKEEDSHE